MMGFLDWIWNFFIGGNVYPFDDENSLPVYAGSILVSIVFAWRFFSVGCAAMFSVILIACAFTTMFCMVLKSEGKSEKIERVITAIHDIILGLLIIMAFRIKADLAIYTFGFIAILQVIVWGAENLVIASSIRQKDGSIKPVEFKKSYTLFVNFCGIATVIIPALLIILFVALCISFPIDIKIKFAYIVGYFIIIPIMSVFLDNYGVSVSDVALFKIK